MLNDAQDNRESGGMNGYAPVGAERRRARLFAEATDCMTFCADCAWGMHCHSTACVCGCFELKEDKVMPGIWIDGPVEFICQHGRLDGDICIACDEIAVLEEMAKMEAKGAA